MLRCRGRGIRKHTGGKAAILLLTGILLASAVSGAVVLNSSERIDFNVSHQRTGLVNATGVDVSGNNVYNLFDTTQCTDYVRGINPDGSYECGTDTESIQNLSQVLAHGNTANTSIDMRDSNINDVGTLQANTIDDPEDGTLSISDTLSMNGNNINSINDISFNGGSNSNSGLMIPNKGEAHLGIYNASGCASCKVMTWHREDNRTEAYGDLVMNNNQITNIGSKGTYFASDGDLHVSEIGAEVSDSSGPSDPAYTFDSDGDTGLYRPGANQVALTTAGTRGLEVTGSQNIEIPNGELRMANGVAIGNSSTRAYTSGDVAIGPGAFTNNANDIQDEVAIGSNTETNNAGVAVGRHATATGPSTVAIGEGATAPNNDPQQRSMALGGFSTASGEGSVAIGYNANAPNTYEATFGNFGSERLDVNVTGNVTIHGTGGLDVTGGDVLVKRDDTEVNAVVSNAGSGDGDAFLKTKSSGTGETGLHMYHQGTWEWGIVTGDVHDSANQMALYDRVNDMDVLRTIEGGQVQVPNGDLNMSSNNIQNVGSSDVDMQYDSGDSRMEITSNGNTDICIGNC